MTRVQFLNDLYHHLYGMTREQAEQHLTYYAEMLADRMEEGMTEEEAVAGMEDVETIARRILEEEGLPYVPSEERPLEPPEYPDASRLAGGGGTRAYQAPKRNWRKPLRIALWVLAAVILLGTVSRWLWTRHVRHYYGDSTANTAIEEPIPVDEAASHAPYAGGYDYLEAPFDQGYEYAGGEYGFDCEEISGVEIQWASGTVFVQSWSGDSIQVQEYANSELSERTRMACETDGDTLTIRYRTGTILGSVKGSKWLTVLVPDGMLDKLDVETISAGVQMYGLEPGELDVSTTSGRITASECYAQAARLATTSGDMDLSSLYAGELDMKTTSGYLSGTVISNTLDVTSISGDISLYSEGSAGTSRLATTSGDIWFSLEDTAAQSVGVSSVSGDVSLSLPYDLGFALDFSTVSGDLASYTDMDMTRQDGKYVYNGGGCEIQAETVSGDLEIY